MTIKVGCGALGSAAQPWPPDYLSIAKFYFLDSYLQKSNLLRLSILI
jgi:hypothetical protein